MQGLFLHLCFKKSSHIDASLSPEGDFPRVGCLILRGGLWLVSLLSDPVVSLLALLPLDRLLPLDLPRSRWRRGVGDRLRLSAPWFSLV